MSIYDDDTFDGDGIPAELVERLRRLRWPQATPEARRRCWELLSREVTRMAQDGVEELESPAGALGPGSLQADVPGSENGDDPAVRSGDQLHERRLRRHEFAGWGFVGGDRYSGALGHRVALAQRATRAGAL